MERVEAERASSLSLGGLLDENTNVRRSTPADVREGRNSVRKGHRGGPAFWGEATTLVLTAARRVGNAPSRGP